MKLNRRRLVLVSVAVLCFSTASWASKLEKNTGEAIEVFKRIEGVAPYFETAYAYAVFPKIGKGGLGVGAARGKGQVFKDGEVTGIATLSEISWGLQAGGQSFRQVIFIENEEAYDRFTSGEFEFEAGAGAIAVTASADASAGTTGTSTSKSADGESGGAEAAGSEYRKGMQVFTIGLGGLMYEVSIAGQKYKFEPSE